MTEAASVPLGAAPVALASGVHGRLQGKARAADHDSGSCFHGRKCIGPGQYEGLVMLTEYIDAALLPLTSLLPESNSSKLTSNPCCCTWTVCVAPMHSP